VDFKTNSGGWGMLLLFCVWQSAAIIMLVESKRQLQQDKEIVADRVMGVLWVRP
jgi:hypothetical protein